MQPIKNIFFLIAVLFVQTAFAQGDLLAARWMW